MINFDGMPITPATVAMMESEMERLKQYREYACDMGMHTFGELFDTFRAPGEWVPGILYSGMAKECIHCGEREWDWCYKAR